MLDEKPSILIGVLGGMGPAATVDFVAKLIAATPAGRDQDHIPLTIWSNPRIPNRNEALQVPGAPSPLPHLIYGVRQLEAQGASFIAIACNTAHHWHGEMQAAVGIPILHIADVAIAAMKAAGLGAGDAIGLMCSDGTLASGYYDTRLDAAGFKTLRPAAAMQRRMMGCIYAVKEGKLDLAKDLALEVANDFLAMGAKNLLLACTELPVALGEAEMARLPCLDVTSAFAEACVRHALALGKRT